MFGQILKELLSDNKISQSDLAQRIGYTQRAVSKWINNQSEPTEAAIRSCAKIFGVSADYLLGLEDDFGTPTAAPMGDGMSSEERKLISVYQSLSSEMQETLWSLLATWSPDIVSIPVQKKRS